ncbi:hypothetical protein CcaCcLH18_04558 [Colletotrichum camelliae]|nr:hypothetical protein CcaCcLH18_04558 [Colletotrichum camelliae]
MNPYQANSYQENPYQENPHQTNPYQMNPYQKEMGLHRKATCTIAAPTPSLLLDWIISVPLKLIIAWPLLCLLVLWSENLGLFRHSANNELDNLQSLYGTCTAAGEDNERHLSYPTSDASPRSQGVRLSSSSDNDISVITTTNGSHVNGHGLEDALPNSQSACSRVASHINTPSSIFGVDLNKDDELSSPRPRYLCVVQDFKRMHYATVKVSDYLGHHGDHVDLDFVFVSYTRMQFRVATEEEIDKYPYEDEATRDANKKVARTDRETLIRWGMEAARKANKWAFWLDFECIRNDDGTTRSSSTSGEVYRIWDIVRAAHSMIIAIGPTASDKVAAVLEGRSPPPYSHDKITPWLRQWGSRLWTLSELLLCPSENRIQLYILGDDSEPKPMMAKRNFAERAWDDAAVVNELVSHFEGTATLTPVNLIQVALECFSRRQTDQFSHGDIAYATMGLFPIRQRPQIDKRDTGFQAFAKLCLSNESGDFLGRLICLTPQPGAQWFGTGDRWGTKLCDISPLSIVREVVPRDTVILDKAHGLPIHWDSLDPEPYFEAKDHSGYSHFFDIALLWCVSAPIGAVFSMSVRSNLAAFLPITAIFALIAPIMLLRTRTRIRQAAEPRLVGTEGFVDVSTLEKHLWGFNHGNLTDSTPLSYQDAVLLNILEKATDDPRYHSFHGILDSCLALLLIMAILSWYTPEEMILRFLLWAILCPRLTLMVVPLKIVSRFLGVEGALTMSNTFACVLRGCDRETKGFSGIFGQPMEISWLPTDQKSFLSLRAAMGKFTLGMNSHWPAKHRLFTMLSRGAIVFAAGVLSKSYTGVWSKTDRDNVIDNVVIVLIASALGLVMYRIPSVTLLSLGSVVACQAGSNEWAQSDSDNGMSDIEAGLSFFNLASNMFCDVEDVGWESVQCLLLMALYNSAKLRVYDHWRFINKACSTVIILLPLYKNNCKLTIANFTGLRTYKRDPGIDSQQKEYQFFFLALVSMRILLNRIHSHLYNQEKLVTPSPSVLYELNRQIEEWRQCLPFAFQFDDHALADEVQIASQIDKRTMQEKLKGNLKARYHAAKTILYRPHVHRVIHSSEMAASDYEVAGAKIAISSALTGILHGGILHEPFQLLLFPMNSWRT